MATHAAKRQSWDWLKDENAGSSLPMRRASLQAINPGTYFRPLSNFFWDIERLLDNNLRSFGLPVLSGMPPMWSMAFSPAINIASTDDEYTITVEIPGMEEKDIRLDVSPEGLLTISGEKRQENEEKDKEFECVECSYGAFRRSLALPDDVNEQAIEARFKNGVLTIACPRREKGESQSRQIPIGGGKGGNTQESTRSAGSASASQGSRKAA